MTTFEDSLQTGAGNAYKWAAVGDTLAGIVTAKNIVTRPNFDGVDEDVPVIQIRDAEGTEYDAWLGKPSMRRAVAQALAKAGAGTKLELGGKLAIRRLPDGVASKVGYSAPHLFEAQYQPPAPTAPTADAGGDASASDLFG
jgi:hypothetical protein